MATSTRGRTSKKGQKSGTFTCSHCPFRSAFKHSVKLHEEHHTVNLGFQCSLCTFSAATNCGLKLHIDRVHADKVKVDDVPATPDEIETNLLDIFHENHKENPIKHTARLIQLVDAMTNEFPPEVPRNTDEPDEDSICRAELVKLAEDMKSAQVILMEVKKSVEEEAASSNARAESDEIRKNKMKELQKKGQSLSAKKAYLLELKERAQQQIAELIEQKNQLERKLSDLTKGAPVNKKIKLDPFSSSSLEGTQEKEAPLSDLSCVKIKLSVIEEEDKDLRDRIRGVDHELAENAISHLGEIVGDLNSLVTRNPATDVQLKTLKREQLGRIAEFNRLQKKIFHISSGHILNAFCRLEEELIKAVGVVDEN